ncbi:hypothetical protein [Halovivax gelatinilyticus]|uniref:hypothetical protein n=1 Tax=Halovivax gelatinilyticus TaxID=2961597 RepID=UPI0020CA30BE|nr:hypothetical protein [Halovivax gelatinilyticus]
MTADEESDESIEDAIPTDDGDEDDVPAGDNFAAVGDAREPDSEPSARTEPSDDERSVRSDPSDGPIRPSELLVRARTHPRDHWVALVGAVLVGLVLSWLHWIGLILGGALVGFVSPSLRRAVVAGLGFGGLVLIVFAASLGLRPAMAAFAMTPATYVTVGAALGLPTFGALVRGLY